MVKVKAGFGFNDEELLICFNHPMVKVKDESDSIITSVGHRFQPPYGES